MDPRWLDSTVALQFLENLMWLLALVIGLVFVVELACVLILCAGHKAPAKADARR